MSKLSRKAFVKIALRHKFVDRTRQSSHLLTRGELSNWVYTVMQFADDNSLLMPYLMPTGNIVLRRGRVNCIELCTNRPWSVKKEYYLYHIDGYQVLRLTHKPDDSENIHNYYIIGGIYNENT